METGVIDKIAAFLQAIGIDVIMRPIERTTFLPGLLVENGKIIADPDKLLYPGDMLHEAGHLAGFTAAERASIGDTLPDEMADGRELMAIAWSYAACLHIGLDPSVVFHPDGYRGEADSLISNFKDGHYIGVPMLQYMGLAYEAKTSAGLNATPYPAMVRWLKE